jgi:hypothetical protein
MADGGDPEIGLFCTDIADCGRPECLNAAGDCFVDNGTPGCNNRTCCNDVCAFDGFCCGETDGDFDSTCAALATTLCAAVAPSNDACVDATPVTLGSTPINTVGATTDGPPLPVECDLEFGDDIEKDVWYQFVADSSGTLTVDLCDGTDYDSRIAIYDGCACPAEQLVGCDDDNCGILGGPSVTSVSVIAGHCYLIRVGGFSAADVGLGTMNLSLEASSCPDGAVDFIDPPSGVVDARQPNPIGSLVPRQGIDTLVVAGPEGASIDCWQLCETVEDGSPNGIASAVESPAGTYTIVLDRPISVGAVTTLTYLAPVRGTSNTGVFTSHPANINGDTGSGALDIIATIDCLNGVNLETACPWGDPYSRDIDQNGGFAPSDILRVIDLLNGADTYDVWNGVSIPDPTGCP